jgi:hypothetical protein
MIPVTKLPYYNNYGRLAVLRKLRPPKTTPITRRPITYGVELPLALYQYE